ncbi:MFS transporter [Cupriavidus sp. IDO]|uniref:MFS transporter n=1 Tax=Cupriavidus sp. IDO TaxID=1539142 RepID=UPI0005795E20|nr:MFS transporter [Cupriavidus sp. IDO]KWR88667.1 MFS transporter [Cupriavidus sp. IDO]
MRSPRFWKIKATDWVLILICLLYLIQYSDRVNIATAAGAIAKDLHLSNTELGFVFSAFAYPYAVVQLFGGWLGDKIGARRMLAIFGLIVATACIFTSFAGGLISLAACRFLLGVGEAPTLATATGAMARWLPVHRRGLGQGLTHACARVGSALTPPLIAMLMALWSWRVSFIVAGVVGMLWVIVWFWYYRDEPASHRGVTREELATLPSPKRSNRAVSVPVLPLLRRMLPVTVVDFCYAWTLWVFLTWLPSFFLNSYQLDLRSSALFTSGVFIAGIVGDTLGGVFSDRIYERTRDVQKARRNVIAGGMAGALVFLAPVLFVKDLTVVTVCLCCAFFCMELVIAPLWAVPMDIAPNYAGTASSFMNVGFGIAGIVSPLVFGVIIDRTGNWQLPFAISIGLLFAGIVTSFFMRPDRPFQDDPGPKAGVPVAI